MFAAAAPPSFEVFAVLAVAGSIIAYISARIGTVPIVGFLASGVVIGPNGLGLVDDLELVNQAADIGIVLLLFTIGIEFSLDKLRSLASLIFGGGAIQVGSSTLVVTGIVLAAGKDWQTAVFTGLLVSLSSTAIVLKMLADRRTTATPTGRVSVSFLIFQDLAIVAMVLVVPMLGGEASGAGELAWAIGKAVGIIVAVLVVARTLVPKVLDAVARTCSEEVFLLTVVGLCFGTAYLTSLADVSISLGAFLAGLMVSESRLSAQALGDIMPLQILFSATFFVSVGMLLDLTYVVENLALVIGLAAAVVAIKLATTALAAAILGRPKSVVFASALVLAQVGEFSFVLERAGEDVGLVPAGIDGGADAFIAVTVFLMVLSPFGIRLADVVAARFEKTDAAPRRVFDADTPVHAHTELHDHVVLAGYGERARQLSAALELADRPYVITTLDPDMGRTAEEAGRHVIQGDITRRVIAEEAGVAEARVVVIADDSVERTHHVASIIRLTNPNAFVLAHVSTNHEATELQAEGLVDHVVADEGATIDALIGHLLGVFAVPERVVEVVTQSTLGTVPEHDGDEVYGLADPDSIVVTHIAADPDEYPYLDMVQAVRPSATGCEECQKVGDRWVHLRMCVTCGHVGCCDSSPNRHARAHFLETGHPIMRSAEPGENWAYSFVDQVTFELESEEEPVDDE
ncbi:MAG: cation:proton antiporter [Actinomycetota bacterium]